MSPARGVPGIGGLALASVAAAASLLCACSRAGSKIDESIQRDEKAAYVEYVDPSKLFSLEVPGNWKKVIDGDMSTKNVSFLLLTFKSKGSNQKALFSMTVYYYTLKSRTFHSADEYVRANTQPHGDWSTPDVESVTLKAGAARRWTRTRPVLEEFVTDDFVVVQGRNGFFVLTYSSDKDTHPRHQSEFEHAAATFRVGRAG